MLYKDDVSTFEEMFKVKKNVGPQLLGELFSKRVYYVPVLRSMSDFKKPRINSVHFGEDSLRSFGYIIWKLIPYGHYQRQ